jgi:predicted N-acetyltransferase YhbS
MNIATITLRRETRADEQEVEIMVREAFWNCYRPGCDEHYLVHMLRQSPVFLPALDVLAEADGRIIGSIMYSRARILLDTGGELPVLSFGPIAVLPAYQGKGVGGRLIRHTQSMARDLGEAAILIYGDPAYYNRYGFVPAEKYAIGSEQDQYCGALQAYELHEGALQNAAGRFVEDAVYNVDAQAAAAYDRQFPPLPLEADNAAQRRFHEVVAMCKPRKA